MENQILKIEEFVNIADGYSGAGACSYNEPAININTGYGDGRSDFSKGSGRNTSPVSMLSDNYKNSGGGGGLARGFSPVQLKLKKINYNERHR